MIGYHTFSVAMKVWRALFGGMNSLRTLLVLYCLDLLWKLAHWTGSFGGIPWWGLVLGLSIRFAVMGWIAKVYLNSRNSKMSERWKAK